MRENKKDQSHKINKKNPAKVVCILLNWNGLKDTLEALSSLKKTTYQNLDLLVVDNGSVDLSVQTIQDTHPDVFLLENKKNLGFAGGNNPGIEWALERGAEWILLLNNDTVVQEDLIEEFLEGAKEKPNGKIFGAKILEYQRPHIIDHLGGFWDPKKGEFFSYYQGDEDHEISMQSVDYVCGAALFMHRSIPEQVGLLEPNFFLFWEESDLCTRARKKGMEIWTCPKARVWHKVSSSFTGGKPHMHYFWWRSRLLWIERNCSKEEKKRIYRQVVFFDLCKLTRHYLMRSILCFFFPNSKRKQKVRTLKAGLWGVFHFFRKRFGSCPDWVSQR